MKVRQVYPFFIVDQSVAFSDVEVVSRHVRCAFRRQIHLFDFVPTIRTLPDSNYRGLNTDGLGFPAHHRGAVVPPSVKETAPTRGVRRGPPTLEVFSRPNLRGALAGSTESTHLETLSSARTKQFR